MAAVVVTGSGNRPPWYRRWLTGAILRRQLLTAGGLLALVVLLLATPEVATSGTISVPPGVTPAPQPGAPGLTKTGIACKPGVRQDPNTKYSPICMPAWHGNNGGATSNGVTGTTITVVYRVASTDELALLYGLLPKTVIGTNDEAIATLQKYADTLNRSFELYGRHVVVKAYTGQGNFINEDTGTGEAQAQADALTVATSLHGFVDMSLVDSSTMYTSALQSDKVSAVGLYLADAGFYRQNSPYQLSFGPDCTKTADGLGALFGRALKGQPASFAGDAALRSKQRVLGIVYPDNPQASTCVNLLQSALHRYGLPKAEAVSVPFVLSQIGQASAEAVAKMKAAGVTTVINVDADPITPLFLFPAADANDYHPEWVLQSYFAGGINAVDGLTRNIASKYPDQGAGILGIGNPTVPRAEQEGLKAYEASNGGSAAGILPSYPYAYASMLYLFDLLQAAGPYLTPQTLAQAQHDSRVLPTSLPGGELGQWTFGPGTVDPLNSYQLMRWSPGTTSTEDGQAGTFVSCLGPGAFTYSAGGKDVPVHATVTCGGAG